MPPGLETTACDLDGIHEELGILSARNFWRWYYAKDSPEGPTNGHVGKRWGEIWWEFLQSDSLALAGAVPLVLQTRPQVTDVRAARQIQIAELKALQRLRQRLQGPDLVSIGRVVFTICNRIYNNIQRNEYELALMDLQAVRRLIDMQLEGGGEVWICLIWTGLKHRRALVSCSRHVPEGVVCRPGVFQDRCPEVSDR